MGWLRDQMFTAETPIKSFGELARRSLEAENWPKELELKPRSLSSLFSKLDREIELDWLLDRPEVQAVLAGLFKRPVADIRAVIGAQNPLSTPHLFRLYEARFARDINLLSEELPPGLPVYWANPYEWGALHIRQAPHRGLELLTAYLSARGRAQVVHFADQLALSALAKRGPLCLVHHGTKPLPSNIAELLTQRRPLLLISPTETPPGFDLDSDLPLDDFLSSLIDWFNERLDENTNFHPERAEAWIKRELHQPQPHWSEVLSILGAFDELPQRSTRGLSAPELAQRFVRSRLLEQAKRTSWGPNMLQHAWTRLLNAVEREAFSQGPASLEQWGQWLSTRKENEDAPAPDEAWMRQALKGALGKNVKQRDLSRAARQLDPSGYQLAQALLASQIIRPVSGEDSQQSYQLNSSFISRCLRQDYARETLALNCEIWGKSLLEQTPFELKNELLQRAERGDESFIAYLADSFRLNSPPCVAAFETVLGHYVVKRLQTHGRIDHFMSAESIEILHEILQLWSNKKPLREPYYCELPSVKTKHEHSKDNSKQLLHDEEKKAGPLSPLIVSTLDILPTRAQVITGSLIVRIAHEDNSAFYSSFARASLIEIIREAIVESADQNVSALLPLFFLLQFLGAHELDTFNWLLTSHPKLDALLALSTLSSPESNAESTLWQLLSNNNSLDVTLTSQQGSSAQRFWEEAPQEALEKLLAEDSKIPFALLVPHQQLRLLRNSLSGNNKIPQTLITAIPEQTLEAELFDVINTGTNSLKHHIFSTNIDGLLCEQPQVTFRLLQHVNNGDRVELLKLIIKSKHFLARGKILLEQCANKEKFFLWSPENLATLYEGILMLCRAYRSELAYEILTKIEELNRSSEQTKSLKDFS